MDEIYLGSHIGLSAPEYFLGTAKEAFSYGENCFMFYTGAPQNSRRIELSRLRIEEGKAYCQEHGIDLRKCVVHAPYIINLANNENPDSYRFGIDFLKVEVERCLAFGITYLVLHPGSRKELPFEESVKVLASALTEVMEKDEPIMICLETMAGKGKEIGRDFDEMAKILDAIADKKHFGVCLDTCHIFDAGYELSDVDAVLKEFDEKIGLDRLKVIHLNDSKTYLGSHKDRHENIGYGAIGYQTLRKFVYHPLLKGIPKILETPYFEGKPPYKKEIALLRGDYEENWRENLD